MIFRRSRSKSKFRKSNNKLKRLNSTPELSKILNKQYQHTKPDYNIRVLQEKYSNNKEIDTHRNKQRMQIKPKFYDNLKRKTPLNLQKQKCTFFKNNCEYNPYFTYSIHQSVPQLQNFQFALPDSQYISLALSILDKSIEFNVFEKLKESKLLTKAEVSQHLDRYIKQLGVNNHLNYEFITDSLAPMSITYEIQNQYGQMSKILIEEPIKYRQSTIQGVLNHEIGTHFIRWYNQHHQIWHRHRKQYQISSNYLITEEGLAAINQLLPYVQNQDNKMPPLLYNAALLYYSCYLASKFSFSKMFEILAKYQPNPDLRWKQCVRAKRGILDTSQPGGMYKDQIYLVGAIQILKKRKHINFKHLHSSKITLNECIQLSQKKLFQNSKIKLPEFLKNIRNYNMKLDIIAEFNMI